MLSYPAFRHVSLLELRQLARQLAFKVECSLPEFRQDAVGIHANVTVDITTRFGLRTLTTSTYFKQVAGRTANWLTRPKQTLGECAEAGALREAFPQLGNLYLLDEPAERMERVDQALLATLVQIGRESAT